MGTYIYDEALLEKFSKWIPNESKVTMFDKILSSNETSRMFEIMSDKEGEPHLELPLICITRDRNFNFINNAQTKRPLSYDGHTINQFENSAQILNAIPISLEYIVNIYARQAKQADILTRNLIFNVINYPNFDVTVPEVRIYKGEDEEGNPIYEPYIHTARMELAGQNVQDNSNEQARFIEGNYTKMSFLISVNDAYLWDMRQHANAEIEIRIDDNIEFN